MSRRGGTGRRGSRKGFRGREEEEATFEKVCFEFDIRRMTLDRDAAWEWEKSMDRQ